MLQVCKILAKSDQNQIIAVFCGAARSRVWLRRAHTSSRSCCSATRTPARARSCTPLGMTGCPHPSPPTLRNLRQLFWLSDSIFCSSAEFRAVRSYANDKNFLQLSSFLPTLSAMFINTRFLPKARSPVARSVRVDRVSSVQAASFHARIRMRFLWCPCFAF